MNVLLEFLNTHIDLLDFIEGIHRIAGKFGKFGESSVIRQTKTIQLIAYN